MSFTVEFHPGRPCGTWPDGSQCWTDGDAHFSVPAPSPTDLGDPPDWDGWQEIGCIDGDDIPAAFRRGPR